MELREKLWNLQTPYFASKIGGLEVSEFLPKFHLFENCYKSTYLEHFGAALPWSLLRITYLGDEKSEMLQLDG